MTTKKTRREIIYKKLFSKRKFNLGKKKREGKNSLDTKDGPNTAYDELRSLQQITFKCSPCKGED